MNDVNQLEARTSRSRSMHEGESSIALCDRLSRTRDLSQRQLPTDHDYAVPTREYQTDQSSLNPAPTAAGPVLERRKRQKQQQKRPHRFAAVDGSLHIRESLINPAFCGKRSGRGVLSAESDRPQVDLLLTSPRKALLERLPGTLRRRGDQPSAHHIQVTGRPRPL